MSWFKEVVTNTEYINVGTHHVHELPANSKLPELTGDLKESIKSLINHPGFNYLMQRLAVQRAALSTSLNEGLSLTEIQLRYLQAGIYWAGQLARDIEVLTQSRPPARPATDNEAAEFERMRQSLDLIGA